MKPGFWYRFGSYLLELPVEKRVSRHSGEVAVTFHYGQYKLSSANAVYSFGKYYTSFAIPFRVLQVRELPLHNALVLGFGLGSVVTLLKGHPALTHITAVDADDVILDLAGKYLDPGTIQVEYCCEDALAFVQTDDRRYDLILSDIFIDDKTPLPMMQSEYLQAMKRLLAPGGLLLFSKLDASKADKIENEQFGKRFREVFPEGFTLDAEGNRVFCARG